MSKFLYSLNGIIPFDNIDYIGCDVINGDIFAYTKFNNWFDLISNCSQAHLRLIMHDLKVFLLLDDKIYFDFTKYDIENDKNKIEE